MPSAYYDNFEFNADILLDLPFREALFAVGSPISTQDISRTHHPVLLNSNDLLTFPIPTQLTSGLNVLRFDGANAYADSLNAETIDLDFIAGNYSLSMWINVTDTGLSEILIGRYEVNVSGWELYWDAGAGQNYLTLRHHHAGGATTRTAAFSVGWTPGTWYHIGISRVGGICSMYRNGEPVTVTHSPGGLIDPETCTQDMVIGTRYTKNANWYKGYMYRPRIWGRALIELEFKTIYELDKRWFP